MMSGQRRFGKPGGWRAWPLLLLLAAGAVLPAQAQTYFYDKADRLVSVAYPDGTGIAYTYDDADNLVSVSSVSLPAAPTGLQVARVSGTTARLTWAPVEGATGIVVMRTVAGTSNWKVIAVLSGGQTSFVDESLDPSLNYIYRIAAQGDEGTSAYSTEVPATSAAGPVRVTWIGQASFLVQNADGSATVVLDPPAASVGYALPTQPADVVAVTHDHSDHNNVAGVSGTARQEATAAGLPFVLIPGFHDNQSGALRGPNTIIRWMQGGINFAHFGGYGQDQLSPEQLADLGGSEVIFVPVGGFSTIDAEQAAALITQVNPRVVILMHFRTALGGQSQFATFPSVVMPFAEIVYKPSTVELDASALPVTTEVWLMEVAAGAVSVNGASFGAGVPVAPGSLVSVFGNFAGATTAGAVALPLPRVLEGTEVLVDDAAVPLLFTSAGQINFQLPRATPVGQSVLEVRVNGQVVAGGSVTVLPTAPGVFVVLNTDGRLNSPSSPESRGGFLQIYATGQGEVSPAVEDGFAAAVEPLSVTLAPPTVTIGGRRSCTSAAWRPTSWGCGRSMSKSLMMRP